MTSAQKFNPEKLEKIIAEKGVRKKWIAEKMSIHPHTLYAYLKGNKVPSASMVCLLALVLGVSVDELRAS